MLGKLVIEDEESKSHQEAEEETPRWWGAPAFTHNYFRFPVLCPGQA